MQRSSSLPVAFLRRVVLAAAAFVLLGPGTSSAALIDSEICKNFVDPSPCNTAENVSSLILGVDEADLTLLVAAEVAPLLAGLAFFDSGNNPVADPFGSDLKSGHLTWTSDFDYVSIKAAGTLYVYDDGNFDLPKGVSNVKVWSTNPVPEPTGAVLFLAGLAVVRSAQRRRA